MGDDLAEHYHALCRQPHVERVEIVRTVDRLGERVSKVVSLTREPPFSHVTVEATLREVPYPLDACLALGPWEQREPDGVFFIPGTILKVAFLGCGPFKGLERPQIWWWGVNSTLSGKHQLHRPLGLECPRIVSTDLDGLRFLSRFGEACFLAVAGV
jgi:hypothetical protein